MFARYLIRFDDICPQMNWSKWERVEQALLNQNVRPILAVVPDNRDPKLSRDPPRKDFWEKVRGWQARGWAIGLHGYQHQYVNREAGMLGINRQSEFAGLGYEEQLAKLRAGLAIFAQEGVRADCWVAPGHSFDWTTVKALADVGIRTISDGFALGPYRDELDSRWIPQQFARMRAMPFGIWTFCYHPNEMSDAELVRFPRLLARLSSRMIPLAEAEAMAVHGRGPADAAVASFRGALFCLRRMVRA
jgi:predicted deacetylase